MVEQTVVDLPNLLRRAETLKDQLKETAKMANGLRMRVDGIEREYKQIHSQIMAVHGGHPDQQKNDGKAEESVKESPDGNTDVQQVPEDQAS